MKSFSTPSPIGQLLWLAFLFLLLLIVTSGITLILPWVGVDISSISVQVLLQGATQLLTFLLAPLLFVVFFREEKWSYFHFDFTGSAWKQGGVAFVMILLLVPLIDWLTVWNDGWSLGGGALESACRHLTELSEQMIAQFLSQPGLGSLVLNIVVMALLPAICEEIFFRGTIQQILLRWFKGNIHLAVWLTAVVFSLAHGDIFGFVPRLLLGLLLGYLFCFSGSLLVNVCAHFANNVLIVLMYFAYHQGWVHFNVDQPLQLPVLLTVCCTLAAVLLFYIYIYKKKDDAVSC